MPTRLNHLITSALGYCCEWFFFQRYRSPTLIAARLGVSLSAVKQHRRKASCESCAQAANCLAARFNDPAGGPDSQAPADGNTLSTAGLSSVAPAGRDEPSS